MVNVLITAGSCVTAMNVMRALQNNQEVTLFSADIMKESGSLKYVSKHFKIPRGSDESYIEEVARICKENKIDFVFPISDFELLPLSKNKERFREFGCTVLVSDPDVIETCCDKLKTAQFFERIGVPTPKTYEIGSVSNFPIMLRKRFSGKSKKAVHLIENEGDLLYYSDKISEEKILNEYIDGSEWTIDVIASKEGKVLEVVPRQRVVVIGGNTHVGQINLDPEMISQAKKIVESLKIPGICCVQCRRENNKNYYFEINARVGSGLDLSVSGGVNMPLMAIEDHLGTSHVPFSKNIRNHLRMVRYQDFFLLE